MRHYETLFVINPDLSEEDVTATVGKFLDILNAGGAVIGKVDLWGRRRMAYEVKKFIKGYYVLLNYGVTPKIVVEMERNFKIDERVIRFLTIKKSEFYDPEAIALAEAEAKAKAAARAAQAVVEEDDDYDDERDTSGQDDSDEDDYDEEDEN